MLFKKKKKKKVTNTWKIKNKCLYLHIHSETIHYFLFI